MKNPANWVDHCLRASRRVSPDVLERRARICDEYRRQKDAFGVIPRICNVARACGENGPFVRKTLLNAGLKLVDFRSGSKIIKERVRAAYRQFRKENGFAPSVTEIVALVDANCTRGTIYRHLRDLQLETRDSRSPYSNPRVFQALAERVHALRERGESFENIARALRISERTAVNAEQIFDESNEEIEDPEGVGVPDKYKAFAARFEKYDCILPHLTPEQWERYIAVRLARFPEEARFLN